MKLLTKKEQNEILKRLIANHIIAQYTLDNSDIDAQKYCDSTECLIKNTCDIANLVGGMKAILVVQKEIERRMKSLNKIRKGV